MGFPLGYSGVPRLLLHLLFLLAHLRRLSSCLLRLAGADTDHVDALTADVDADPHCHALDGHSPALRFDALSRGAGAAADSRCAVCLHDFHAAAEVRRPQRCRHVFHRACLDRWAAHAHHRTCPLCRLPLLPPPVLLPLPSS